MTRPSLAPLWLACAFAAAACWLLADGVRGQESAPSPLLLAQSCFVEANWSHADCTAIAFVIRARSKRAGSTFTEMLVAYSAIDADSPRATFARQLPDGDEPTWNARTNARWRQLRRHAAAVLTGNVRNPCVGARDWGARNLPNDVRRAVNAIEAGRWRVVQCEAETANAFYAEVSR